MVASQSAHEADSSMKGRCLRVGQALVDYKGVVYSPP
jgi:hypothetical protein